MAPEPWSRGPALLFCPADRPERYASAAERADAAILDLEDAVRPEDRAGARRMLAAADLDPARVIVRINPLGTADAAEDLRMLADTAVRWVMVAKSEDAGALDALDDRYRVLGLCETARGVREAAALAEHPLMAGLMWGAEDLVASLGGSSSRRADGSYRDVARHARSAVLVAAGAAGIAAVDAVHLDIADLDGLRDEAEDAAAVGFRATACIHPSQVETIRAAYRPDPETLAWARDVLDAAVHESGVFAFRGRMVDEPVLRHARAVMARA